MMKAINVQKALVHSSDLLEELSAYQLASGVNPSDVKKKRGSFPNMLPLIPIARYLYTMPSVTKSLATGLV
jgi:hypothetical protein